MAQKILDDNSNYYVSNLVPTGPETANSILGNGGNDTIYGNGYVDFIFGGDGNDILNGMDNDDTLDGDAGNDTLNGGNGDDFLVGNQGSDSLYGGAGYDTVYGGADNDRYVIYKSDGGIDTINDNKTETGQAGYGGGVADYLYFKDVTGANIRFFQSGNDLWVTDVGDIADGFFDTGAVIEDFFLHGAYTIERVYGSDNAYYDISTW